MCQEVFAVFAKYFSVYAALSNGHDREEMVTEMALVMTEFYTKYERMPPPANCKKEDKPLRIEYEQIIAKHFLSNHGQILAGENAAGCNGLKNVEDVFGGRICSSIASLAKERSMPDDPIKTTNKIAGINKLGKKKVKDNSLDLIRNNYRKQAINSYAGEVLIATGSNTTVFNEAIAITEGSSEQTQHVTVEEQQESLFLPKKKIEGFLETKPSLLVSFNLNDTVKREENSQISSLDLQHPQNKPKS